LGYSHNWNSATSATYATREVLRSHRAVSAYTTDIHEGRVAAGVHAQMNPHGVMRESRDSDLHPESLAIATFFDVTGSMGKIPRELQRRLVNQMTLLTTRHYVDHPQQFFGAIGDATCDQGSLQVGQFEVGLEMDDDLERVWVESGGGGQQAESYELAYYFAARHMATDCYTKRNKKGYLFTMGDEMPYDAVSRSQVLRLCGDHIQADIPIADIISECAEKWNLFHLLVQTPTSTGYARIGQKWRELLPEGHVIEMADPKNVAEVIALIIGISEGRETNPAAAITQLGADGAAVVAAVRPFAAARGIRLTD
jgi:hypothetical protein